MRPEDSEEKKKKKEMEKDMAARKSYRWTN